MIYHDISQQQLVEIITQAIVKELALRQNMVPVGISVRHVHLSREALDRLFGRNYMLTPKKNLSQPGQFAAEECVDIIGQRGVIEGVRILGPERDFVQVELSQTDCRTIGIKAPLRSSGDVAGTPGITLRGPMGEVTFPEGVIIADRHLHVSPSQGEALGLKDGDHISVLIGGEKPGVLGGILVRCSEKCDLDLHLDTDDGNAFGLRQGQFVKILGKEEAI